MIDKETVKRLSKNQDYKELVKDLREERKRLVRKLVELSPDDQLRNKFVELQGKIFAIDYLLDDIYIIDNEKERALDVYDPYDL